MSSSNIVSEDRIDLLLPREAQDAVKGAIMCRGLLASGKSPGVHPATHRGQSLEFAELRAYAAGDDRRAIDYKVLARTDKVYVRTFYDETNMHVMVVVDGSGSMSYGEPVPKLLHAVRVAAALCYGFLLQGDEVSLVVTSPSPSFCPRGSGMGHLPRLLHALASAQAAGTTDLVDAFDRLPVAPGPRDLVVVLTDLLFPAGRLFSPLGAMKAKGAYVGLVHVLSPQDVEVRESGVLRFKSVETGAERVMPAHVARQILQRGMNRLIEEAEAASASSGIAYVRCRVDGKAHQTALKLMDELRGSAATAGRVG